MEENGKYCNLKRAYKVFSVGFCAIVLGGVCFGKNISEMNIPQKVSKQASGVAYSVKKFDKWASEPDDSESDAKNDKVVSSIAVEHAKNKQIVKKTIASKGVVPKDYKHALNVAKDYLDSEPLSKASLYEQLFDEEHFSKPASQYAIDNVHANWNKLAVKSGQDYINFRIVKSKHALVGQLKDADEFTKSQAKYAVKKVFDE